MEELLQHYDRIGDIYLRSDHQAVAIIDGEDMAFLTIDEPTRDHYRGFGISFMDNVLNVSRNGRYLVIRDDIFDLKGFAKHFVFPNESLEHVLIEREDLEWMNAYLRSSGIRFETVERHLGEFSKIPCQRWSEGQYEVRNFFRTLTPSSQGDYPFIYNCLLADVGRHNFK